MKHYKPYYATGLFVLALCGLTSFNPITVYSHLAQLEEGSQDLAQNDAPEPEAQRTVVELTALADQVTPPSSSVDMSQYDSGKESFTLKENQKGIYYTVDGSTLTIKEIKKVTQGFSGSKVMITYKIDPSEKLSTEVQNCDSCKTLIQEERSVELDVSYENFTQNMKAQNEAIKNALTASFNNDVSSQIADTSEESLEDTCIDLDYRDGKNCFMDRFRLAEQCEKESSRSERRSRSSSRNVSPKNKQNKLCESAPRLEDVIGDFKDWASSLATEDDLSTDRIERLRRVSNDSEVQDFLAQLDGFQDKVEDTKRKNNLLAADMNALNRKIAEIDANLQTANPQARAQLSIERKKLILAASSLSKKVKDDFTSDFSPESTNQIVGASKVLRTLEGSYESAIAKFKDVFAELRLAEITSTTNVTTNTPTTSMDISNLTPARNGRGLIDNYDYNSLRNSFTNNQGSYQSTDPHLTQYQPNSSFQQQRFTNTNGPQNLNQWRNAPRQQSQPWLQQQPSYNRQQPYAYQQPTTNQWQNRPY